MAIAVLAAAIAASAGHPARADDGDLRRPAPPGQGAPLSLDVATPDLPADLSLAEAMNSGGNGGNPAPAVVLLAMAKLLASDPARSARQAASMPSAADMLQLWRAQAMRWVEWIAQPANGPRVRRPLDWPLEGVNLRIYPRASRIRLPHDVLAARGGTELEVALTIQLLASLIVSGESGDMQPVETALRVEPLPAPDSPEADGQPLRRRWNLQARFAGRGALADVAPLSARPGPGATPLAWETSTLRTAVRELLDLELAATLQRALPDAHTDRPARIAALEYRAALLETVDNLAAGETTGDPSPVITRLRSARVSVLIGVLMSLAELDPGHSERAQARIAELIDRVRQLGGETPELLDTLARRELAAGNTGSAIEQLERLVERFPRYRGQPGEDHPLIRLARLLAGAGRMRDALQRYRAADDAGVASGDDLATAARIAWDAGDRDAAMELYESAEQRGYGAAYLYVRRGMALRRRAGATPDHGPLLQLAITNFRAAVRVRPADAEAWWLLISCELKLAGSETDGLAWARAALEHARAAAGSVEDAAPFRRLESRICLDWLDDRTGAVAALRAYLAVLKASNRKDDAAQAELDALSD